jgi:hypothetical protein
VRIKALFIQRHSGNYGSFFEIDSTEFTKAQSRTDWLHAAIAPIFVFISPTPNHSPHGTVEAPNHALLISSMARMA